MLALTTAFITATLALGGKLAFDWWGIYRERRAIAASLAGEIGAYLMLLDAPVLVATLQAMADEIHDLRQEHLRLFGNKLPTTHPVFDKVADRVGLLSVDVAFNLSRFYNVISGLRLLLSELYTDRFLGLSEAHQQVALRSIALQLEAQIKPAQTLEDQLGEISRQKFRCFVVNCGSSA